MVGFAAAVAAQFVVLYAPSAPGAPVFAGFDKLVHAAVFAAPVVLGLLAGMPAGPLVVLVALHAPVSEVVQHEVLPGRSGDLFDLVADLTGVALGVLITLGLRRRRC